MLRLLALLSGCVLGAVMIIFGLELTVRTLFPEWYAVPFAVLQMTGQKVPAPQAVAAQAQGGQAQGAQLQGAQPEGAQPQSAQPEGGQPQGVQPLSAQPTPVPNVPAADQPGLPGPLDLTPEAVPTAPTADSAADTDASVPEADTSDTSGPLLPARRFNVLLLGSDNDLKFTADAVLTQSMILVSIDPKSHDVAMISIPRDFWVPITNYGYQKIDVAYEVGGIGLARSTVEKLFGIKIDYYAWVGLNGLVQVIDTLGGVDVTVQHPILDEMYPDDLNATDPYAFFRLYIPAGPQHLDGTTALEYVRSRHGDLQSDFGRSARQQQVLLALKSRFQSGSSLGHVPQLVTDLQGSVKTDLSLPALLQLAAMARSISPETIHQQVLSAPEFASLGNSPDGTQQVVFPNWTAIRPVIARLVQPSRTGASEADANT